MLRQLSLFALFGLFNAAASQITYADTPKLPDINGIELNAGINDFLISENEPDKYKALLEDEQKLKEFVLDLYSDLKLEKQALEIGLEDEIMEKRLTILKRQMLLRRLFKQRRDNIEYPDFSKRAEERYLLDKEQYKVPEKRMVSHILLIDPEKKKAKAPCQCADDKPVEPEFMEPDQLYEMLKNNEVSFEDAAKEYSDDLASGKDGGKLPAPVTNDDNSTYVVEFANAVFAIPKVDDISKPIRSSFGWHIIKLHEIQPTEYKTFDDVKANIIENLKTEYRNSELQKLRGDAYPDLETLDMDKIRETIKTAVEGKADE